MRRISSQGFTMADAGRHFAPAASIMAAILLMMLPLPLAWGVMPDFALLLIIIWARIQPRLLPAWAAFLLGLFADATFGLPFGIFATVFPITIIFTRIAESRFEGQSLIIDWAIAALLVLGGHLLAFELLAFAGRAPVLLPMLAQAGITALAFPIATMIAARLQLWLAGDDG